MVTDQWLADSESETMRLDEPLFLSSRRSS